MCEVREVYEKEDEDKGRALAWELWKMIITANKAVSIREGTGF